MTSEDQHRFDVDALRDYAGERVFERGERYCRDGAVDIVDIVPSRVLALVHGTEDYRTVVTGRGARIDGDCSCPAYAREGFCKHMVATALAANAAGAGDGDRSGRTTSVRDYLKTLEIDALVDMIVDLAEYNPPLWRRLELAAVAAADDDKALERRLRKAVAEAIRTGGYVDYREAPEWSAGVASVLDTLDVLASGARAGMVVELAQHAVSEIEDAIGEVDDSDGYCSMLLDQARDIHLSAFRAAGPEPVELARKLFALETDSEYGTFNGAAAIYSDVLGDAGLAEYRRLAFEAWDALPARSGNDRRAHDVDGSYSRLAEAVDFFAERDGDIETRIAVRTKDLSSPWQYLRLVEFCSAHGEEEQALRYAEEGLWVFEDDRPDEKLVSLAADLLRKAGRREDADKVLWRCFDRAPSLSSYRRLRAAGDRTTHERAVATLRTRLAEERATRWYFPADLLIDVLMEEKLFDAAWAAVDEHGASRRVKQALAKASEATHASKALAVYAERVEELARAGGNAAYHEAADLVGRMAGLHSAAEQAAYVTELKKRHRRKRNLMKVLG